MSSQESSASTIPYEEIAHLNNDFVSELDVVGDLFFDNYERDLDDAHFVDIVSGNVNDTDVEDDQDGDDDDFETVQVSHPNCVSQELNDYRPSNVKENYKQETFKTKTCGCKLLYGKPCSTEVPWEVLIDYRLSCLEKTPAELDVLIKVQLFHSRNDEQMTSASHRNTSRVKNREKARTIYNFRGIGICRETFAFAHGLSRKTVDTIAKSLETSMLEPRTHGNVGKLPAHAVTLSQIEAIISFIRNYASCNGLPLPGRTAMYRDKNTILLPSDRNKVDIHGLYCNAVESSPESYRKVSLTTFRKIWADHCSNVLVMRPSTDLCVTCQKHNYNISHCANLSEEQKLALIQAYQTHVCNVRTQRDDYRAICETTKATFNTLPIQAKQRGQAPCSQDIQLHYSFDYAQQVLYPHYAQQVGPLFFKTPRKCQCFGVCCEASGTQIFYLMDEEYSSAGKGANSVVSCLHHHFSHHGYGERRAVLHMDNCPGQNKNNIVIGYGLWRVMNGLHDEVVFSTMEAGHTKFAPDMHFGLWKVKWRRSNVESMDDMKQTVTDSSRNGYNIPQTVDDEVKPVIFYNWLSFFKPIFQSLPKLKEYHHYRMTSSYPGTVFVKRHANDDELPYPLLKDGAVIDGMPNVIQMTGLDAARQWYLFNEVAPLCHNSEISCPRPEVPRPKKLCSKA